MEGWSGNKENFSFLVESGKFDKIFFVIKMTTENERTASSQISEDETQKMHKKRHVVGVVF